MGVPMPPSRTLEGPLRLRLYVAGSSANSVVAAANLRALLEEVPEIDAEVEIIDVLVDPDRARHDGVIITPMLVRVDPAPERRLLGNLRDRGALRRTLGLDGAGRA